MPIRYWMNGLHIAGGSGLNLCGNLSETVSPEVKVLERSHCTNKSWSVIKIVGDFQVSTRFARNVQEMVKKQGMFPTIPVAPGVRVQKRLILCNLKEAHLYFKERNPDMEISFPKFAQLRRKCCVLAGSPGTHIVCVCQQHENVKLMTDAIKLRLYEESGGEHLKTYKECPKLIRCETPNEECVFGSCPNSPGLDSMREILEVYLNAEMMEDVTHSAWIKSADNRCKLETVVKENSEFIDELLKGLKDLIHHDFLADKQRKYLQETMTNLKEGEAVVLMDFAENYSMLINQEVPGYHWTNDEATIHPYVI
ncbi:hypothetical protein FOCC_FOCC012671 [Frankliniella occidentalis]|nr:hypothetical protein FOCC_FOCC012671 [Frankliniella occidentalis]